jgi:hypothetical protein
MFALLTLKLSSDIRVHCEKWSRMHMIPGFADAKRTSLDERRQQRTFRLLWRPDHPASSLLPLRDAHLVTSLQTTLGIEAEGPVERRADEPVGHSQLGSLFTISTLS